MCDGIDVLRALLTLLALCASFSAGVYFGPLLREAAGPRVVPAAKPAPPARAEGKQTCRDECEQRAIVYQLPDSVMLTCIAQCPVDPKAPRETPRSISVAPADHRK